LELLIFFFFLSNFKFCFCFLLSDHLDLRALLRLVVLAALRRVGGLRLAVVRLCVAVLRRAIAFSPPNKNRETFSLSFEKESKAKKTSTLKQRFLYTRFLIGKLILFSSALPLEVQFCSVVCTANTYKLSNRKRAEEKPLAAFRHSRT
jgi:hypothetical protein